jgi:hypothetical protein
MGNKHVGSSLYEFLQEEVFWKRPALSRLRKWSHGRSNRLCLKQLHKGGDVQADPVALLTL